MERDAEGWRRREEGGTKGGLVPSTDWSFSPAVCDGQNALSLESIIILFLGGF